MKIRKVLVILTMIVAMVSCNKEDVERTVLFSPGDYGSQYYRIPAVITASDGSIVAFTDKRKYSEADLPEDIDVLCNYSTDNGKTWSEPYVIVEGQGRGAGFGDCAVTRTAEDGGLVAVFVGGCGLWESTGDNPQRSYMVRSNDNGRTWSKPRDITHYIYGEDCTDPARKAWRASFFGSGNGLLMSDGRIMFVAAIRENDEYKLNNYVVYSDDNGETWHLSQRASVGGDEAKVVELADGSVLMSIRHGGKRWYNISKDGGVTWNDTVSEWDDLMAPACNGDIIRYSLADGSDNRNILLHSLPQGDARRDVSVYYSLDEGVTWNFGKCVVPRYSAYSSLCVLPDGSIGLYVEERENDTTGYEMVFYRFGIDWLMEGEESNRE